MRKIILASASPRRKRLLTQIGLQYKVVPSNFEERINTRLQPKKQVEYLSLQKAQAIADKYENAVIIAADTLVVFGKEILGKPHTKENAKKMLQKLSGKPHQVITGFTLFDTETGKKITKSETTTVFMKRLTQKEIDDYVATEEPLDKAGGYGIDEKGAVIIEKIEGDFFNVVGLPLFKLTKALEKFGVIVL